MKTFLSKLALPLLFLVCGFPAPARAGEATEQIRQTTDALLAVAQDPALKSPDKDAERQKRMRETVDARFDWNAMARSAFGKHWRDLSEARRAEFTGLFSELIKKIYLAHVEGYSGEKVLYKGDKIDGAYGVVEVVIVTLRGTDIPVSYRVLNKGAAWLVYDVSIEGVSMVNNYRSQIGSLLNSSSYETLISRIKTKIAAPPPGSTDRGAAGSKQGEGTL